MSIQAGCSHCGRRYQVKEEYAGQRLSCKQCGKKFRVPDDFEDAWGDDDYDDPSATIPPRRPSRKRKTRRGSGIHPGVKVAIVSCLAVVLIGALGWGAIVVGKKLLTETHESLLVESFGLADELCSILESVEDKESAEAGVPELEALTEDMVAFYKRQKALKEKEPLTDEEKDRLEEKYKDRIDESRERMKKAVEGLRESSEAALIVMTALQEMSREIRKHQFEEHMADFQDQQIAQSLPQNFPAQGVTPSAEDLRNQQRLEQLEEAQRLAEQRQREAEWKQQEQRRQIEQLQDQLSQQGQPGGAADDGPAGRARIEQQPVPRDRFPFRGPNPRSMADDINRRQMEQLERQREEFLRRQEQRDREREQRRQRFPGGGGFGRPPVRGEELIEKMKTRWGEKNVLTVNISDVGTGGSRDIYDRLREMAGGKPSFSGRGSGNRLTATLAPVADVKAFAELIDFGIVNEVDETSRTISVTAEPAYKFTKGRGGSMPAFQP